MNVCDDHIDERFGVRPLCPNPNCVNGRIKGTGVGCAICERPLPSAEPAPETSDEFRYEDVDAPADATLLRELARWCKDFGGGLGFVAVPRIEKLADTLDVTASGDAAIETLRLFIAHDLDPLTYPTRPEPWQANVALADLAVRFDSPARRPTEPAVSGGVADYERLIRATRPAVSGEAPKLRDEAEEQETIDRVASAERADLERQLAEYGVECPAIRAVRELAAAMDADWTMGKSVDFPAVVERALTAPAAAPPAVNYSRCLGRVPCGNCGSLADHPTLTCSDLTPPRGAVSDTKEQDEFEGALDEHSVAYFAAATNRREPNVLALQAARAAVLALYTEARNEIGWLRELEATYTEARKDRRMLGEATQMIREFAERTPEEGLATQLYALADALSRRTSGDTE